MKDVTRNDYYERMLKVMIYIEKNLERDISLEELADVACFSPYHFHRIFQGMLGESVAEYVRRLRIEKAAVTIRQRKDAAVSRLAFEACYNAVETFSRAFKNHFGKNPSQFKREYLAGISQNSAEDKLKKLFKRGAKMSELKIVKREEEKIAFVRHIGPYKDCGAAWDKICSWAGAKGLINQNTKFMGICHDDPEVTEASKIRYDASVSISGDIEGEGEIMISAIPAGNYASYIHTGSFNKLYESYNYLCGELIPASGREIRNVPSIEIYLNDPDTTPEDERKVQILIAVE